MISAHGPRFDSPKDQIVATLPHTILGKTGRVISFHAYTTSTPSERTNDRSSSPVLELVLGLNGVTFPILTFRIRGHCEMMDAFLECLEGFKLAELVSALNPCYLNLKSFLMLKEMPGPPLKYAQPFPHNRTILQT